MGNRAGHFVNKSNEYDSHGSGLKGVPYQYRTKDTVRLCVGKNGTDLFLAPPKRRDARTCAIAVSQDGRAISGVPSKLRNSELSLKALGTFTNAFDFIPAEHIDRQFVKDAITCNVNIFKKIKDLKHFTVKIDRELCEFTVRKHPSALPSIPEEFLDQRMCQTVFDADPNNIAHIPERFITVPMCKRALQTSSHNVLHVPDALKQNLVAAILSVPGAHLNVVPLDMKTTENCELALVKNIANWPYVPNHIKGDKVFLYKMIQKKPIVIRYAKDYLSTTDYDKFISDDIKNIVYIPAQFVSDELYTFALTQDHSIIKVFPDRLINQISVKLMSDSNILINVLQCIKTQSQSKMNNTSVKSACTQKLKKICKISLSLSSQNMDNVKQVYEDVELYGIAVNGGYPISSIPKKFVTSAMCTNALRKGCPLENIPVEARTPKIYEMAVRKGYDASKVPLIYRTSNVNMILSSKKSQGIKVVKKTDSDVCAVCLCDTAMYVAIPCGHMLYCAGCQLMVLDSKKCIGCSQPITRMQQVFRNV